ncbi:MAG: type II secretion system protein [Planctomycetota bacterium]|nr:type II secretion system protein [Planctomycetota bacterium]
MRCRNNRSAHGGFTLIEAMVATVIVATGGSALMVALASGTTINANAREMTQATYLAQEVREWTYRLPLSDPDGPDPQGFVDDIGNLTNVSYSPPLNGLGLPLTGMSDWTQKITVTWRNSQDLSQVVPSSASDIARIQVDILHSGKTVLTNFWFVSKRTSP